MILEPLTLYRTEDFFIYLDDHLADNGVGETFFFHPFAKAGEPFSDSRKPGIRSGIQQKAGEPEWKRFWLATSDDDEIIGHVDLRAYSEPNSEHRVLLGMGVKRDHRGKGLGKALMEFAIDWARSCDFLEWLDLYVISTNLPALKLYRNLGFKELCTVEDRFRVDGKSYGYTMMTLAVS
ncbi:GNAT family N-acetyltransferase [Aliikangiella sp. G2MR2-5]|uniref:GNAT family N-acetyltransferase n=1 Tax=Aliikangiella sp. G2MR2-5 TaxID=2788943 RepID=UPI0018A95BF6|nr:GNAT family N-acetyltransferase [Aliikangiella sp. G2MR2-5]